MYIQSSNEGEDEVVSSPEDEDSAVEVITSTLPRGSILSPVRAVNARRERIFGELQISSKPINLEEGNNPKREQKEKTRTAGKRQRAMVR